MPLRLTERDQAMLDGNHGPAVQMAMSILVQMANVYGAPELMDISAAHIDSTIYIGKAGLEFAERLASLGARVAAQAPVGGEDGCLAQHFGRGVLAGRGPQDDHGPRPSPRGETSRCRAPSS